MYGTWYDGFAMISLFSPANEKKSCGTALRERLGIRHQSGHSTPSVFRLDVMVPTVQILKNHMNICLVLVVKSVRAFYEVLGPSSSTLSAVIFIKEH